MKGTMAEAMSGLQSAGLQAARSRSLVGHARLPGGMAPCSKNAQARRDLLAVFEINIGDQ